MSSSISISEYKINKNWENEYTKFPLIFDSTKMAFRVRISHVLQTNRNYMMLRVVVFNNVKNCSKIIVLRIYYICKNCLNFLVFEKFLGFRLEILHFSHPVKAWNASNPTYWTVPKSAWVLFTFNTSCYYNN